MQMKTRTLISVVMAAMTLLPPTAASADSGPGAQTYSGAMKALKKYASSGSRLDRMRAENSLRDGAEAGSADAQFTLYLLSRGRTLSDGNSYPDIRISAEEGVACLERAAASGHTAALAEMAGLCYDGYTHQGKTLVDMDRQKSFELCLALKDAGLPDIESLLGHFHMDGRVVGRDYEEALKWFRTAYSHGALSAIRYIGRLCYLNGDYREADKAFEELFRLVKKGKLDFFALSGAREVMLWAESCAAMKDFDRMLSVMNRYLTPRHEGIDGRDIMTWNPAKQDALYALEASVEDYYRSSGNPAESALLRHIYRVDSIPKPEICYARAKRIIDFNSNYSLSDREKHFRAALPWLRKAKAYRDDVSAFCYQTGRKFMDEDKLDKAMEWFGVAIDEGGDSEAALYAMDNLASCHIVRKEWNEAFGWLDKAYSKGFDTVCHNLGDLYYYGHGTGQSYERAFSIFSRGMETSSACRYRMGVMLREGLGVERDTERGNSLLLEAAEQGLGEAQYLAARCLYDGDGMETDYSAAVAMSCRALENRFVTDEAKADICRMLAACYRFGRGVAVDEAKAEEYTSRSAALGNADALKIQQWLGFPSGLGPQPAENPAERHSKLR